MKEMFEEYGGTVGAVIGGMIMVGIITAIFIPGNPIGKAIVRFLTITMPFSM